MTRPCLSALVFAWAVLASLAGCAGAAECVADDDCPLDAICHAGSCDAIEDAGEGEGEGGEGEGEGDGGEGEGDGGEGEGEGDGGEGEGEGEGDPTCSLADGAISDADLAVLLGLPIRTLDATSELDDLPVDVDGVDVGGELTWDFTTALPDEGAFSLEAVPLADQWFAADIEDPVAFANGHGTYVAPLSSDVLGVFEKSAAKLVLRAVASTDDGRTLIQYDPPILVLALPLHEGDAFSSSSIGTGTYEFNPFYASSDDYDTTVDARGVAHTLAGDFPVLRVKVEQSVTVGFLNVSKIQYVWITPCLGTVVQVESADGETDPSFTTASHVRRLAAP